MTTQPSSKLLPHEFTVKGEWSSTSLTLSVPATDAEDAVRRAENQIKRMEGGVFCQRVHVIKQTR